MGFFDKFKTKFERAVHERHVKPTSADLKPRAVMDTKAEPAQPRSEKGETVGQTAHRILARPYITEKTATLASTGTYVFVVAPSASKIEVKRAVEEVYGTRPVSVRMISREGKRVRFGRALGVRKSWKKALVTMPPGKTLPIYE